MVVSSGNNQWIKLEYAIITPEELVQLNQLKDITLKYTKITPEEYQEHIKDDWWMTADEALKYGVCDEIAKEFV